MHLCGIDVCSMFKQHLGNLRVALYSSIVQGRLRKQGITWLLDSKLESEASPTDKQIMYSQSPANLGSRSVATTDDKK